MKTYRVIVEIVETQALLITAVDEQQAARVAELVTGPLRHVPHSVSHVASVTVINRADGKVTQVNEVSP